MASKIKWTSVFLIATLLTGCKTMLPSLFQEEKPKVNIVQSAKFDKRVYSRLVLLVEDGGDYRVSKGLYQQIEDDVTSLALAKGYTIVARSESKQIIKEIKFQKSILSERKIAEIGNQYNVPALLMINVNNVSDKRYDPLLRVQGNNYYKIRVNLSARILDVNTSEVLWVGSLEHNGRSSGKYSADKKTAVLTAVKELGKHLPN